MSKNNKNLVISLEELKTLLKKAEDNEFGIESALILRLVKLILML